ncbi:unnamed protein product, partial [Polarella glacialis]
LRQRRAWSIGGLVGIGLSTIGFKKMPGWPCAADLDCTAWMVRWLRKQDSRGRRGDGLPRMQLLSLQGLLSARRGSCRWRNSIILGCDSQPDRFDVNACHAECHRQHGLEFRRCDRCSGPGHRSVWGSPC